MPLENDDAVVLQRLDYSESSQVLVFFTRRHGKVRAIAKGVKRSTKKRFAVGIDLLELGHLVFSIRTARQSALAILTEWKPGRPLGGLRTRLDRLYAAQYAAETTSALTEDWDPHPHLYEVLVDVLSSLAEADAVSSHVARFQCALLHEIGSWPYLQACVSCGCTPESGQEVWFSSNEGGLLCRDCEGSYIEKRQISPQVLAVLNEGDECDGATPAVVILLDYHIAHVMGRPPKVSQALTKQLSAPRPSEPRP